MPSGTITYHYRNVAREDDQHVGYRMPTFLLHARPTELEHK